MNDRIKELALQAGYEKDMFGIGHWDMPECQKFAELIVRECIKSIQSDMDRETMNRTISLAKHAGMVSAKTVIKKHFGVEE